MNIRNRIKRIESESAANFDKRIGEMSDDALKRLADKCGRNYRFAAWLQTLPDEEFETLRFSKPGAGALKRTYYEH